MTTARLFLVERYVPDLTAERLAGLARASTAAARAQGATYLGSFAVPRDDTCFCLFEASSNDEMELLAGRVGLPHERIVGALSVRPNAVVAPTEPTEEGGEHVSQHSF